MNEDLAALLDEAIGLLKEQDAHWMANATPELVLWYTRRHERDAVKAAMAAGTEAFRKEQDRIELQKRIESMKLTTEERKILGVK